MKIAAFYENIKAGVEASGISMREALSGLKEAGLELLYMNYEVFEEDRKILEPVMKELGLGVEGIYRFLDFAHLNSDERYKDCIDLAVEMHADNVLLIPGMIEPGEETQSEFLTQRMIEGLKQAVSYGELRGVKVTLEDFDGMAAPFNSIRGMQRFFDEIPGLYCAFDTGNFIMYKEDEMEGFHLFKDRTCTVHVKDRSFYPVNPKDEEKIVTDGSGIYPCPVGKGHIRIDQIIGELKKDGYEGTLIAELYGCDEDHMLDDIRFSIEWLKNHIKEK